MLNLSFTMIVHLDTNHVQRFHVYEDIQCLEDKSRYNRIILVETEETNVPMNALGLLPRTLAKIAMRKSDIALLNTISN